MCVAPPNAALFSGYLHACSCHSSIRRLLCRKTEIASLKQTGNVPASDIVDLDQLALEESQVDLLLPVVEEPPVDALLVFRVTVRMAIVVAALPSTFNTVKTDTMFHTAVAQAIRDIAQVPTEDSNDSDGDVVIGRQSMQGCNAQECTLLVDVGVTGDVFLVRSGAPYHNA